MHTWCTYIYIFVCVCEASASIEHQMCIKRARTVLKCACTGEPARQRGRGSMGREGKHNGVCEQGREGRVKAARARARERVCVRASPEREYAREKDRQTEIGREGGREEEMHREGEKAGKRREGETYREKRAGGWGGGREKREQHRERERKTERARARAQGVLQRARERRRVFLCIHYDTVDVYPCKCHIYPMRALHIRSEPYISRIYRTLLAGV